MEDLSTSKLLSLVEEVNKKRVRPQQGASAPTPADSEGSDLPPAKKATGSAKRPGASDDRKKPSNRPVDANWQKLLSSGAVKLGMSRSRKRTSRPAEHAPALATAEAPLPRASTRSSDPTADGAAAPERGEPTRHVAIDCEMVGVGSDGKRSALVRISMVNFQGEILYDAVVRPEEYVTDFRTAYSGVQKRDLRDAVPFSEAQATVAKLLKDRIIVGHALNNDFRVLLLPPPHFKLMRDSATFPLFKTLHRVKHPKLAMLAQRHLGLTIQEGAHDSVEDARVCMHLYRQFQKEWDQWANNPTRQAPATQTRQMKMLQQLQVQSAASAGRRTISGD